MKSKIAFILFALLISCTSSENKDISTFNVTLRNFENSVMLEGFVEPIKTTTVMCPPRVDGVITYLVEDGTHVKAGDTICILEYQTMQTRYESLLTSLEDENVRLNKTKAELDSQYAMLKAEVESNEASVKISQLDSLELSYSPPNKRRIKELELEKTLIQKNQLTKKLKALDIINKAEIRKIELQIQRFSTQISTIKTILDALTVVAPIDGMAVISINRASGVKNTVGAAVWFGMEILKLPDLSEMKINIKAVESEFKAISVGDSVVYTFDAMPENIGWGKIKIKMPVGAPLKPGSKVKVFDLEASIDSVLTTPSPGYKANCKVILKQLKDTLVIPQVAIFEEDSLKVVYVKNNKGFEMRQISTGISSSKEIVVTAGLNENDVISLTRPNPSSVKKKVLLPVDSKKSLKNDSIAKEFMKLLEKNSYKLITNDSIKK